MRFSAYPTLDTISVSRNEFTKKEKLPLLSLLHPLDVFLILTDVYGMLSFVAASVIFPYTLTFSLLPCAGRVVGRSANKVNIYIYISRKVSSL